MPILVALHRAGITANQITFSAVIVSLAIGVMFWHGDTQLYYFLALPIGLLLRMALNALDGMMARIYRQQSKKGEALNEVGDVVSDLFIYFPLLKFEADIHYWIVLFLTLSVINEFAGLLAKSISGRRRYDGPMGKSDRAFLMGVYGLLAFFQVNTGTYLLYIFAIINTLLVLSTFLRIKRCLTHG